MRYQQLAMYSITQGNRNFCFDVAFKFGGNVSLDRVDTNVWELDVTIIKFHGTFWYLLRTSYSSSKTENSNMLSNQSRWAHDSVSCLSMQLGFSSTFMTTICYSNLPLIAVIFKSCYSSRCIQLPSKPHKFECICLSISTNHGPLTVLAVYRPGSESITSEFFDEFSILLETLSVFNSQLLIVGDFNVHIDNVNDVHGQRLLTLLSDFDLQQSVHEPTHEHGISGSRYHVIRLWGEGYQSWASKPLGSWAHNILHPILSPAANLLNHLNSWVEEPRSR